MKKSGRYSKEFKREAIRLLNERNKPISEIAMELGMKRTLLYRWRDQLNHKGEEAFWWAWKIKKNSRRSIYPLQKQILTSICFIALSYFFYISLQLIALCKASYSFSFFIYSFLFIYSLQWKRNLSISIFMLLKFMKKPASAINRSKVFAAFWFRVGDKYGVDGYAE